MEMASFFFFVLGLEIWVWVNMVVGFFFFLKKEIQFSCKLVIIIKEFIQIILHLFDNKSELVVSRKINQENNMHARQDIFDRQEDVR
jgi:hypothetical protein